MPVPSNITDLSKIAADNSPQGTEAARGTIDDYFRAHASFIRQLADLVGGPTVTLASAATVNIGFAQSSSIVITGTSTITAFDTTAEGTMRWVTFAGALTLTHNAASMQLPGSANIVTVAGDTALFKNLGGGNWKCLDYVRASGNNLVAASNTRDGYLTATDWNTFNGKQAALGFTPYNASNPAGYMTASSAAAQFVDAAGDSMSGPLTVVASASPYANSSAAFTANGAFGGGYRIVDGGAQSLTWMESGTLNWGFGIGAAFTSRMTLTSSGVLTAQVITETSDERKKKSWQRLPGDFIGKLAGIRKAGLFTWRRGGARGLGVGAQSLEAILPEAVHTDEKGAKTVQYSAAALVGVVELARAVVDLRARLAKLEAR
jgi:hypothetical protein